MARPRKIKEAYPDAEDVPTVTYVGNNTGPLKGTPVQTPNMTLNIQEIRTVTKTGTTIELTNMERSIILNGRLADVLVSSPGAVQTLVHNMMTNEYVLLDVYPESFTEGWRLYKEIMGSDATPSDYIRVAANVLKKSAMPLERYLEVKLH